MLRDEHYGFSSRHSSSLQLARFVERISRTCDEKKLTGAVFLDVAKAFDTVWIDGLLYKLTLLNFPSKVVHTISSYLPAYEDGTDSVPKRRHMKFRRRRITQKKAQNKKKQHSFRSTLLITLYLNVTIIKVLVF
jgi:hypothetical protein